MDQALKEKITLALPNLEEATLDKLVSDILRDGLTSVDELKRLDANTLTNRYGLPYFKALELADRFQSIGTSNQRGDANTVRAQSAQLTDAGKKFSINWEKFPPTLLKAISEGKVPTEFDRKEMVRRIVEDVRHQVPFAERSIFDPIAQKISTKFPNSFDDLLMHSKINKPLSLCSQLKNCFDNARRLNDNKTELEEEAPARNPRAYGCRRWQLVTLPPNENEETQEEKRKELMEIMETQSRRNWDWEKVIELMEATYGTLRKEINVLSNTIFELQKAERLGRAPKLPRGVIVEDCVVSKLTARWPFLFTPQGNAHHFQNLTDVDMKECIRIFIAEQAQDLLQFFLEQENTKVLAKKLEKLYKKNRNPSNDDSLLLMTILMMFSSYFKEDYNAWLGKVDEGTTVEIFSEHVDTSTLGKHPVVLSVGKAYTARKFYVTVDQEIETSAKSFLEAFSISFGFYYIFGLNYPTNSSQTMDFFQRGILGINPKTGTKTTTKKGTRPTATISGRLLRFCRKFKLAVQEAQDVHLNLDQYNLMREQLEDDL